MKTFLKILRRSLWTIIIAFMIAWHNVYHQDDRLREEDTVEVAQLEEDREKDGTPLL